MGRSIVARISYRTMVLALFVISSPLTCLVRCRHVVRRYLYLVMLAALRSTERVGGALNVLHGLTKVVVQLARRGVRRRQIREIGAMAIRSGGVRICRSERRSCHRGHDDPAGQGQYGGHAL